MRRGSPLRPGDPLFIRTTTKGSNGDRLWGKAVRLAVVAGIISLAVAGRVALAVGFLIHELDKMSRQVRELQSTLTEGGDNA